MQFSPTMRLNEAISKNYNYRLDLKKSKDPLERAIKVVLNSIYGKTAQRVNNVMGNIFSPAIASYITGYTRAQLYQFVVENNLEREVVAFATDSVCTTSDLNLKSSRLDFSLDKSGDDAYYLQNGIDRINQEWKRRGIGSIGGKTLEHLETIEKDGRLYLVLRPTRSASLRECIIQGRIWDIGKLRSVKRLVNLNADRKRLWLGSLRSIDDELSNDSLSISLNHFSKEAI